MSSKLLVHSVALALAAAALPACSEDSGGTTPINTAGMTTMFTTGGGGTASVPSTGGTSTVVTTGGTANGGAPVAMTAGSGGMAPMGTGGAGPVDLNPMLLSETGLYADIPSDTLAPGVMQFTPQFALWTDTAQKRRWIKLPDGAKINSSNMDFWTFPEGTKVWKEFSRDGVRVETRILWKQGAGAADWFMMAYKWNAEGTDAVATPDGEVDASGTLHDIPSQETCGTCHRNMRDRTIGFSAVQLSHPATDEMPGITMDDLVAMDLLSDPPTAPITVPGNDVDKAALGYLHANCGMCHNDRSNVYITKIKIDMWLRVGIPAVEQTATYLDLVGQETEKGSIKGATLRIDPGNLANSAVYQVMNTRDALLGDMAMMPLFDAGVESVSVQMPPVGTEIVDDNGIALLTAWINQLGAQ